MKPLPRPSWTRPSWTRPEWARPARSRQARSRRGPTRRSWIRLTPADLFGEATAGLLARPSRMLLTTAGTALGIAALVTIAGLTTTAGHHIVTRFDALAATEVVVTPLPPGAADQPVTNVLPWDAEARLSRLAGVRAAGTVTEVEVDDARVSTLPVLGARSQAGYDLPLVAASPGLLAAVHGRIGHGRWFDHGHDQRADPVAVLGPAAADRLGLGDLDARPAVFVGDVGLTVIGVLADVRRQPTLLDAVIIPAGTARAGWGTPAPDTVQIRTTLGAARAVGAQAALALAPHAPESLAVAVPPEPTEVRATVADDVRRLFLLLGALSLVIGGLGIANTTLVGVLERTSEIGLRRSLGATRGHIAAQFMVESVAVGTLGGLVGTSAGVLITVAVSAVQGWVPVLEPWVPLAGLAAGTLIGLAAGTYPAWRAAGVEPIAALRSGP